MTAPTATTATTIPDIDALYAEHVDRLRRDAGRLLEQTGWDGMVVHAGAPQRKSMFDDQYWPLRPTPHFAHWLPLAEPDCALLVRPGERPVLYRNTQVSFWEAPPAPEGDHFWSAFEVVEVAGADAIGPLLPRGRRLAFVGEDARRAAAWGIDEDRCNPRPLLDGLDRLRAIKSAYERRCIDEANRRAAAGHAAVLAAFRAGDQSELELHLEFLRATGQDDPETPYKNIVALGEHAATLHHVSYGRTRAHGAQSLLIDAGATCHGYHSDVTRTAVKGRGAGADAFAALIAGVDALQQEVCRRVRAGVPYQELHNQSHELLAEVLRDVGIATASAAELVDSGATRKFLPHGLGHSLGLQTHDVGCARIEPEPRNPFLRNTSDVEPGQVFTIEPGCYFIDSLLGELRASDAGRGIDWRLVGELRRFGGVRIEDDVAVLDAGVRNMTRDHLPAAGT